MLLNQRYFDLYFSSEVDFLNTGIRAPNSAESAHQLLKQNVIQFGYNV